MTRLDFTSYRLCVDAPLRQGARVDLTREQTNYLVNVLRLGEGAGLLVFNGRDGEWRARLAPAGKKAAALFIEDRTRAQEPLPNIDYLFAPIKHARLDYMAQKAVEMGVRRLRPVLTRRTQTSRVNLERMRANVIEAAEQCGLLALAEVLEETKLDNILSNWPPDRLLIFCDEAAETAEPFAALQASGIRICKIRRSDRAGRRLRRGGATGIDRTSPSGAHFARTSRFARRYGGGGGAGPRTSGAGRLERKRRDGNEAATTDMMSP